MSQTSFTDVGVTDGTQPLAVWHSRRDTVDVLEHAGSLPEWALQYEQLSSGAFSGQVEEIHLPGAYMVRESMNRSVRQQGAFGQHMYGFAMLLQADAHAICNAQRLDANALLVGRGDDLDLCTTQGAQIGALSVDCDFVNHLSQRIYGRPLASWLNQQVVVPVGRMASDSLRVRLNGALADAARVLGAAPAGAAAVEAIRDDLLLGFLDALPWEQDLSHLKSIASRRRVVDRARAFVLDHADCPPSLLQVCSHVGASERKLNYCFQETLGLSPARYLRIHRLNKVRRHLKHGRRDGLGVQDVAALWGFWHFGQFSADYKRQFGELPSQTLRFV